LRLLLVSPLPPAHSGVADFSAALAEALAARSEVTATENPSREALAQAERRLYQIGNNGLHGAAYEAALQFPGVVELHDAVLHHLLLGRLDREQYVAEIVYNEGEWARGEAERLWERRGHAPVDEAYFKRPMLRRIVEAATAVIVHNPAAAQAVRAASPQGCIFEIPHFVDPPDPITDAERLSARERLGLADDQVLVSCFGFQRPTKRLRSVLRSAARIGRPLRVLIAGRFVSADYEQSLAPLLEEADAIRVPWVPEEEFRSLAAATDVCANLRYPGAGETSGIAMRLMALARPVVMTEALETAPFPDSAVFRIDSGELEEAMLEEALRLLVARPDLRRTMGAEARRHILAEHALDRLLPRYFEALS